VDAATAAIFIRLRDIDGYRSISSLVIAPKRITSGWLVIRE
jgi:hypothetical protein